MKTSVSCWLWKTLAFAVLLGNTEFEARASEVTPEMASRAVTKWRATRDALGCTFGKRVASARRCEADGAKFNIVKLEDGGFVVTSADTAIRPIVFFSDGDDVVEDPNHPLYVLLTLDQKASAAALTNQTAGSTKLASATDSNERLWAELLDERPVRKLSGTAVTPSDIRVAPLVETKWSQNKDKDRKKNVYDYYTPNHYCCGCVATALAQILRFHQYPTESMPQFKNPRCAVEGEHDPYPSIDDGEHDTLTSIGGVYDWANMVAVPDANITEAQQQAIGKLCYDAGVSVSMSYASGSSASSTYFVPWALKNRFGYSNAIAMQLLDNSPYSPERRQRAMITNFDAGLPVQLGLGGTEGGHSIVGDGYGYVDGDFCCHLNFGWSGGSDGWYLPPPTIGGFNIISPVVYNIYPTRDASQVIISGRVLTNAGSVAEGLTVKAKQHGTEIASATTNAKGIFALFVQPGSYVVEAATANGDASAVAVAEPTVPISNGVTLRDGNPSSMKSDVSNSEICNAHVGDLRLMAPSSAVIGNVGYATLAAALAAAEADDTIHLLQNVTENLTVTKSCTIELDGYTITGTLSCTHTEGAVTLSNGTVTGDITSNASLVFESGTYTGTIHAGAQNCTINGGNFASLAQDSTGVFEINGGRFASDVSAMASFPDRVVLKSDGAANYPWYAVKVMRTVSVSSLEPAAVILSFGEPDRHAYTLCLAYGETDGGNDKRAWTTFVPNVATIAADATTCTVALPPALRTAGLYYRFFLMETAATGLPYVQDLEYIQSTGSQYIDTGVIGKSDTQMTADVAYIGGSDQTLLGALKDDTRFYLAHVYYLKWRTWAGDWNYDGTIDFTSGTRVTLASEISTTTRTLSVDGVESFTEDGGTYDTGLPMYLFAGNVDGTATNFISARVYSMDLTQNDTLVRRFRPVKLANGDGALYDDVTETVFPNKSSTAFTLGELPASVDEANRAGLVRATTETRASSAPVADTVAITAFTRSSVTLALSCQGVRAVYLATGATDGGNSKFAWDTFVKIGDAAMGESTSTYNFPAGVTLGDYARIFVLYTNVPYDRELDYIQSGSGQYIDTGVVGRVPISMEADITWLGGNSCDKTLIGARQSSSTESRFYLAHAYYGWQCWIGDWNYTAKVNANGNRVHLSASVANGKRFLSVDGVTSVNESASYTGTDQNLYLFAANMYGSAGQQGNARVHALELTQDDVLVRRFIPVYINGAGALYDEASATVFTNQKAGTAFGVGEHACGSTVAAARKGVVKASSQSLALAETLNITEFTRSSVTLDVTGLGGRAVYLATGATDGGDNKYAWDSLVKLGDINSLQSTYTFSYPAGTTLGNYFRILVMRTDVPYDREVEYVQSTTTSYGKNQGKQFIDTGVVGRNHTKMDCHYTWMNGNDSTILGSRAGDTRYFMSHMYWDQRWCVGYGIWDYQGDPQYSASLKGTKLHVVGEFQKGLQTLYVDDVQMYRATSSSDLNTGLNMYVFGVNWDGVQKTCINAKLYDMSIWQDGVLVRKFIPVVADGKGALYDEVTDAVFPNGYTAEDLVVGEYSAGSELATARKGLVKAQSVTLSLNDSMGVTEFTESSVTARLTGIGQRALYLASGTTDGGDDKYAWDSFDKIADIGAAQTECTCALPEGKRTGRYARLFLLRTADLPYTRELAYIGSSGTQYIKTGVTGKNDTKTEGDLASLRNADTSVLASFGSSKRFYAVHLNGSGKWSVGYSGFHAGEIGATLQQRVHVVSELYNGRQSLTINGVTAYSGTEGTCDTGREMFLFAMNYYGNPNYYSQARVYNLAITQNNTLMRKYVPVVVNGKGALYDYVSDTVFTNQGTGDFALGEAADEANRRGLIKAQSASFPAGVVVVDDTANDQQVVTVPTDVTFNVSNYLTVETGLEKQGAGTLVLNVSMADTPSITAAAGIVKVSGYAVGAGHTVTVKDGGAFDIAGCKDNACKVVLEGTGPDGQGALRNTGSGLANNLAQLSGITLTGDALIKANANFGLLAPGHGAAVFELNGHTLTVDYAANANFWMDNAQGTSSGTVLIKGGVMNFCKVRSSVPNVSYVVKNGGTLNIDFYGNNAFAMAALTVELGGVIAGNANNVITVSGAVKIPAAFAFMGTLNLGGAMTIDATDEPAAVPTLASTLVFGNATEVKVDVTGRTFKTGWDVLIWPAKPASATFVPYVSGASRHLRLFVSDKGISVRTGPIFLFGAAAMPL